MRYVDTFGSRGLRFSECMWDEHETPQNEKGLVIGRGWFAVGSAYTFLSRVLACPCADVWQKEMIWYLQKMQSRCMIMRLCSSIRHMMAIQDDEHINKNYAFCVALHLTGLNICTGPMPRVDLACGKGCCKSIHRSTIAVCSRQKGGEFWIFWHILPARYWSKVGSLSL